MGFNRADEARLERAEIPVNMRLRPAPRAERLIGVRDGRVLRAPGGVRGRNRTSQKPDPAADIAVERTKRVVEVSLRAVVIAILGREHLEVDDVRAIPTGHRVGLDAELHAVQIRAPIRAEPVAGGDFAGDRVRDAIELGGIEFDARLPRMIGVALDGIREEALPAGCIIQRDVDVEIAGFRPDSQIEEVDAEEITIAFLPGIKRDEIPARVVAIGKQILVVIRIERAQIFLPPILKFLIPRHALFIRADGRPCADDDGRVRRRGHANVCRERRRAGDIGGGNAVTVIRSARQTGIGKRRAGGGADGGAVATDDVAGRVRGGGPRKIDPVRRRRGDDEPGRSRRRRYG